jgi:hypothetical protein
METPACGTSSLMCSPRRPRAYAQRGRHGWHPAALSGGCSRSREAAPAYSETLMCPGRRRDYFQRAWRLPPRRMPWRRPRPPEPRPVLRHSLIVVGLSAQVLLVGCAAESYVLVGTSRPPISPDQVKIYLHAPAKYEEIAIVDASSRGFPAFTDQQKMNKAMARLKEEAASLGANGVLLEGTGDQQAGAVGTGVGTATATGNSAYGTGVGVSAGIFIKSAKGLAIYVPP